LRHSLGISKPYKKRINVLGVNWSIEYMNGKGNKTVPEKVATSRTEDGDKQNTNTSTVI
jgi:hypothetical protein